MFWVLQLGLEAGHAEDVILEALQEQQLPHTCVTVVPFSHEMIPEPKPTQDRVVVYGGIGMKTIADQRGWSPGCYLNDNFTFERWRNNWGTEMLNHDSLVCRFEDVPSTYDHFFVRPNATDKSFTGITVTQDEYIVWREEVLRGETTQNQLGLTADTVVAVAPYRKIQQECRFFVAGGNIVTGSFYRSNSWHKYIPFFDSPWYSKELHRYVQARVEQWCPDDAFVLDVAVMDDGYKIIEINCYNTSGLYECDARAVVMALEELEV